MTTLSCHGNLFNSPQSRDVTSAVVCSACLIIERSGKNTGALIKTGTCPAYRRIAHILCVIRGVTWLGFSEWHANLPRKLKMKLMSLLPESFLVLTFIIGESESVFNMFWIITRLIVIWVTPLHRFMFLPPAQGSAQSGAWVNQCDIPEQTKSLHVV